MSFKRLSVLTALLSMISSGCSQALFFVANAPTAFEKFSRATDLAYGSSPRQRLDIYAPSKQRATQPQMQNTVQGKPVIVFVHGGGWNSGDKSLYKFVGAALAQQGYIAVLPNYRLYPQVHFAEQMQDVAQAMVWAHRHASEWGGDPQRLFIMGHSAGAHLAMMLALNPQYLAAAGGTSNFVQGVIGLAGPYNFIPFTFDYMFDLFGPPENYPATQPINYVSKAAPPVLLIHGRRDRTVDPRNTITLFVALQAAGADVRVEYFDKADHSDLMASFSAVARDRFPVMAELRRFIDHAPPRVLSSSAE